MNVVASAFDVRSVRESCVCVWSLLFQGDRPRAVIWHPGGSERLRRLAYRRDARLRKGVRQGEHVSSSEN